MLVKHKSCVNHPWYYGESVTKMDVCTCAISGSDDTLLKSLSLMIALHLMTSSQLAEEKTSPNTTAPVKKADIHSVKHVAILCSLP